jgi:hypothetical protein
MTGHKNQSEQQNSATLLQADRSGFVPQPIRHGLFNNSINGFTPVFKSEGAA